MKLLTYQYAGRELPGVLSTCMKKVYPLSAFGFSETTLEEFIIDSDRAALNMLKEKLAQADGTGSLPLKDVKLVAPIPAPRQQLFCLENNYYASDEEKKKAEQDGTKEELPTIYWKKATAASGPDAGIPSYPDYAGELDCEPGIGVITAADIRVEEVPRYIFGYTIVNNVISRQLHRRHRRPVLATSLDGFLPMGPWIVTADEWGDTDPVFHLQTWVNGKQVQDCSSDLMKFSPRFVIGNVSQLSVLKAASIFWMGTPYGCGKDQTPPRYFRKGDEIVCEVREIGVLRNYIV